MSGETKKRLLLSKWRGLAARIETLEAELDDSREELKEAEDERDAYADSLERELLRVKYWLHDGLVLGKLVSNPRDLLRSVEEVLG